MIHCLVQSFLKEKSHFSKHLSAAKFCDCIITIQIVKTVIPCIVFYKKPTFFTYVIANRSFL